MSSNNNYKKEARFALTMGSLYTAAGLIQILLGLGIPNLMTSLFASSEVLCKGIGYFDALSRSLFISPDILGGFVLLVVGATFLSGVKEIREGINEGMAYVYVGVLLAFAFALVYLLIMSGNALEAFVVASEDFENWTLLSDMRPGVYLAVLALPAYLSGRLGLSLPETASE